MIEHVTTLVAQLDRRFDTLHQDLKDSITDRFTATDQKIAALAAVLAEHDRRYQQRHDASQLALKDALLAQDKAVRAALAASELAVQKSEAASEKRFDSVNEFRQQLGDQAATFFPRNEAESRLGAIAEKIEDLKGYAQLTQGRDSGSQMDRRFDELTKNVDALRLSQTQQTGQAEGKQLSMGFIVTGVGLVATILTIVIILANVLT